MLQLEQVTITQEKDLHTLIEDLSLTITDGEKLAIIGEEGTGKSTLLKAIYNPKLLEDYASLKGKIHHHFEKIAYLPQFLAQETLEQSLYDFFFQDLDYQSFDFNHFYQLAGQLNLDNKELERTDKTVGQLSGGEKIKYNLLKALSQEPNVLLLDEPSSDLDIDTISWLEHFIRQAEETILFISHDERLLEHSATAILHLELVKKRRQAKATFFKGNYQAYKLERQESFERQLRIANKEREEHAKRMEKSHRIHQSVEYQLRNTKNAPAGRLLAKKLNTILSQEKRYEKEAQDFTEIPEDMDSIALFFSGITPLASKKKLLQLEHEILLTGQTISLEVYGQEKIAILGKNGIGKTQLLKKIRQILLENRTISLGYMPQSYEEELPLEKRSLDYLADCSTEEQARNLLASLKFTREEILHPIAQLSGGQKAKLFLARMVLAKNNVLLLDEPTRHFSPTSQPIIRQLLQDFPGAIICVSHDRTFVQEVCDKSYRLNSAMLELCQTP